MAKIGPVTSFMARIVASRTWAGPSPAKLLDVLQHHDGVVDHDANRQHKPEERQVVQGEAHQAHDGERALTSDTADVDHRGMQQGFPVLQEQQDDEGDQEHRVAQGVEHLIRRTRG